MLESFGVVVRESEKAIINNVLRFCYPD
jgi:hypothetical protein